MEIKILLALLFLYACGCYGVMRWESRRRKRRHRRRAGLTLKTPFSRVSDKARPSR